MTEPFVSQVRTSGRAIELAAPGAPYITVRVQMMETWDTVGVRVSPDERVITVKVRALEVLYLPGERHEDYVLKLHGWEVLDEQATLAAAGAIDGSIFLMTHRRRIPVR